MTKYYKLEEQSCPSCWRRAKVLVRGPFRSNPSKSSGRFCHCPSATISSFANQPTRTIQSSPGKSPDQRLQDRKEAIGTLKEVHSTPLNAAAVKADSLYSRNSNGNQVIGEKYEAFEQIGQGGMGTVLKARHTILNKLFAIKILNSGMHLDKLSLQRFEQEARAGGKLAHPNLVAVVDFGFTINNEPYLVMEYVDGESLEGVLKKKKQLSEHEFIDTFTQVLKALQYIHKNGIVHRDIKPSNIIVQTIEADTYVKLLDFGIAKIITDQGSIQQLTATGLILGSPLYMSPEQCKGEETDFRSDIYSLGCVMYECLSGYPPLVGEHALHTMFRHTNDEPDYSQFSSNGEDSKIATMLKRCLAKSRTQRFNSVSELISALNEISAVSAKVGDSNKRADFIPSSSPKPLRVDTWQDESLDAQLPVHLQSLNAWHVRARGEGAAPASSNHSKEKEKEKEKEKVEMAMRETATDSLILLKKLIGLAMKRVDQAQKEDRSKTEKRKKDAPWFLRPKIIFAVWLWIWIIMAVSMNLPLFNSRKSPNVESLDKTSELVDRLNERTRNELNKYDLRNRNDNN